MQVNEHLHYCTINNMLAGFQQLKLKYDVIFCHSVRSQAYARSLSKKIHFVVDQLFSYLLPIKASLCGKPARVDFLFFFFIGFNNRQKNVQVQRQRLQLQK